jgi:predicted HAD superfamily Cof-like phosphohydrolase
MTDKFYNGRRGETLSNFESVGVFMHTFNQEVKHEAEFPSKDICKLRVELIAEELGELKEAIRDKDIVEVADALTDLLYVVYGAGHAFGIDLDKCFNEVHRSNMSKLGLDGKPIYREDGKVLKGQNYFDPDLITIVQGDNNGKETNE